VGAVAFQVKAVGAPDFVTVDADHELPVHRLVELSRVA